MAKNPVVEKTCRIVQIFHRFGHDTEFVSLCGDFTAMYLILEQITKCVSLEEAKQYASDEMKRIDRNYGIKLIKR